MSDGPVPERPVRPGERLPAGRTPAEPARAPGIHPSRIQSLAGNRAAGQLARGTDLIGLQALAGNRAVAGLLGAAMTENAAAPMPPLAGPHMPAATGPPVVQRQGGGGPSRKHTFKLPEIPIAKKIIEFEYGEAKDLKLGGEFGLEPIAAGGGESAGKMGVVLGPGEAGIAAETAEKEINETFVPGLTLKSVKGVGTATTKEVSFGAQADFKGDVVDTEVKLNLFKLDIQEGEASILPLTFTHHWERFFELPPVTVAGYQYKLSFKPLVEWTAAAKWSAIGRDIAEKIGPELLAEAAFTLGPILVAVGTVAGIAYELYYADEFRELPGKMYNDTVFTAMSGVKALYGDPGYAGEPYTGAYAKGRQALDDLKKKMDPHLVEQVLRSGVRKDVLLVANTVPYDALFEAAYKRAVDTWTQRHPTRASLIGVPGTITRLNQNRGAIDDARSRVRDYVLSKTAELPR